jgi:hypothetical protein
MDETLLEFVDSRGTTPVIDREAGLIRGVKILGLESRNNRTYTAEALVDARALYEGVKVNVNHPRGNPAGPREYQDRIGVIRNVTVVAEAGLFGDLHFNPCHPLAGQLEWDARHAPENVGLSHNVLARTAKRGERTLVEAITRVISVDLVADPATTSGLFEERDPATVDVRFAEQRGELERLASEVAGLRQLVEGVTKDRRHVGPQSREQSTVEPAERGLADAKSFVKAIRA